MSLSTSPKKWMKVDGTLEGPDKIIATNRGWERQLPNGQTELLHAISGLGGSISAALVVAIRNPADGNYEGYNAITGTPATMDFYVSWAEALDTVTGTPRIALTVDVGGADDTIYAEYVEATDANTLKFTADLADLTDGVGLIGNIGSITPVIDLNGGSITTLDDSTAVDLDFPSDYEVPALYVIMNAPTILSIVDPAAGTYSQGTSDPLSWVVTFDEAVDVAAVDGGLLVTDGVGSKVIPYASGTGTSEITFTQTANNMGLGEIVGVEDPALDLGTGGDEYQDADNNNAETARPSDYSATSGIIIGA